MPWPATFIYVALVVLSTWLWNCKITDNPYIHNMGIVVGIFAVISWIAWDINMKL